MLRVSCLGHDVQRRWVLALLPLSLFYCLATRRSVMSSPGPLVACQRPSFSTGGCGCCWPAGAVFNARPRQNASVPTSPSTCATCLASKGLVDFQLALLSLSLKATQPCLKKTKVIQCYQIMLPNVTNHCLHCLLACSHLFQFLCRCIAIILCTLETVCRNTYCVIAQNSWNLIPVSS